MYFDKIKAELTEAADVLNKFLADENNIKLIQKAALLISESLNKVVKCCLVVTEVLIVMRCILRKN